jgi:hypothetical protein
MKVYPIWIYRISNDLLTGVNDRPQNIAMLNDYYGLTYWFSIVNQSTQDYVDDNTRGVYSCKTDVGQDTYLVLSLPYTTAWKAFGISGRMTCVNLNSDWCTFSGGAI